jgi:hypothetical protein
MDIHNHVGRLEMHSSIWVSGKIIKYLLCLFHRALSAFHLFTGDCAECH